MKILIIVNEFPPDIVAGTAMSTFYLSKYLSRHGNEVHVAVTAKNKNPSFEKVDGVNIYRIKTKNIKGTRSFQRLYHLYRLGTMINPDIIQGQAISCGMFASLIGKILKKPSITYIQGYDLYHASTFQKFTEVKIALKYSKAILAVSEDLKANAMDIFPRSDIFVMPHGLEIERGIEVNADKIRQEDMFLKNRIILFVGQLTKRKGLHYLIEAMRLVHDKIKNARLLIIGEGNEKKALREMVTHYKLDNIVHFLGAQPHATAMRYMKTADIFVLPSLEEAFGIVLIEAMSQGLPIVATQVQGIPYIIKDGINGYLVPARNDRLVAEKILFLLNDKEIAKEIGEKNRKYASQFHWSLLVEKYLELYSRLQNP